MNLYRTTLSNKKVYVGILVHEKSYYQLIVYRDHYNSNIDALYQYKYQQGYSYCQLSVRTCAALKDVLLDSV